jgi:hypothetical protein
MKILFLIFFISFTELDIAQPNESMNDNNNNITIRINKLENNIDSLDKEINNLKIEKEFYQTIIDNNTTYYITIIALITFVLGAISFTYFLTKSKKINDLLEIVKKQEERIGSLLIESHDGKIESDYTYANVCNILAGIELNEPYLNFNKSFYYYMRTLKYLLVSERLSGVPDNLTNARSALFLAKNAEVVSSQGWKLEKRHIDEIRSTFLKLSLNKDIIIQGLVESIMKDFENNLDKLKGK